MSSPTEQQSGLPSTTNAMRLQREISRYVITSDGIKQVDRVCGADVSYVGEVAYCSAVIISKKSLELIESINAKNHVKQKYISGLFMLRESEPVIRTLKLLKNDFDLLLVDGHGMLHPRRCGLACYIGVTIDKPTIGVAKRLLCGMTRKDGFVELDGEVLGKAIVATRTGKDLTKKVFVSVGHKVSLRSAIRIVRKLTRTGEYLPEPLRIADILSKRRENFSFAIDK